MKVKLKLPLIIVLVSTIPILIVSIISYFFVLNLSWHGYQQIIDNQSNASAKHLADFYSYQSETIADAALIPLYNNLITASNDKNSSEYNNYLSSATEMQVAIKKTNKYVDESYMMNSDGTVLTSSDLDTIGTGFSETPSFINAMNSQGVCSEIMFQDAKNKKILLSVAIKSSTGDKIGVLMREINMDYISSYIKNLEIGDTGYLYVLDSKGNTISHFYDDRVTPQNVQGNDLSSLEELIEEIREGTIKSKPTGFFEYMLQDKTILANYQLDSVSGWTIVAAITEDEIYMNAEYINIVIILLAVVVMTLSVGIGLLTIRSITKPLSYISQKIKSIASGNLLEVCEYNSKDEFKDLCENINIMTNNLYESQQILSNSALTDALTGLPNRKSIYITMDKLFNNKCRQASLLIDLDGFKAVNDTLGHDYGDDVLCSVAKVLESEKSEIIFPCRLGGDEFFIFVSDYSEEELVINWAQQILNKIKNIKEAMGKPINISASIGVAFIEEADKEKGRLIKKSDVAMYNIKNSGKSMCKAFDNINDIQKL